ncbi:hypothetical protein VII00023_20602 [Vibrio ichthyoenteri ATCC 700023]|uniref:Uncharacterized protein n=1 Tax=Vibrio ichthyoenteri ATCC 700023 TaxID=870968 RepID=F9S7T3_9VIBR|nr:hypothetical protein [Vibrio ichthyoenteri]EGU30983.1 hypothetical protein VII00023_20602 [Vibrio ichthyoenteri ATCC 700023]
MQYALMRFDDESFDPIIDSQELHALHQGLPNINHTEPTKDHEKELERIIVYGSYMPQPDLKFPRSEIRKQLKEGVGKWLAHMNGLDVQYLKIEDIVPFFDVTIMSSGGHYPKPHATPNIAFAALVNLPTGFKFHPTFASSAFVRWSHMDILSNVLNRDGLYALIAPEKRFKKSLTTQNWRNRIDQPRAIKLAQKWR